MGGGGEGGGHLARAPAGIGGRVAAIRRARCRSQPCAATRAGAWGERSWEGARGGRGGGGERGEVKGGEGGREGEGGEGCAGRRVMFSRFPERRPQGVCRQLRIIREVHLRTR